LKNNRLQKFETKTASEPSSEQIQQAKEWMINSVMQAYDRLPKDIQPVSESFAELARQAKFGVPRQSTRTISSASEKTDEILLTKFDSGDAEKTDENLPTKFDSSDLAILESLKNAE
jgi:cbb3-type cytochrome oxidase cytochrome c subunit